VASLKSASRARGSSPGPERVTKASSSRPRESRASLGVALGGVAILLIAFLATQYRDALRIPFINDDYIFLEKTRGASFGSLWGLEGLSFHWYRPWSREFHYWWLQRAFGPSETAFHLASLALWIGVMMGYFVVVRRSAGTHAAAFALAGLAAMSAWAVPVLWVAGVQELWALLLCLLSLEALARGRTAWSAAAFGLALLSKETAAVLPGIALLFMTIVERRTLAEGLRRIAPHAALALTWAAVHPMFGGRFWSTRPIETAATVHHDLPSAALRTLGALVDLDGAPSPDSGTSFVTRGLIGAVILISTVLWARRAGGLETRSPRRSEPGVGPGIDKRVLAFGAGWALLGWMPALAPAVGWHAYYTLLGAMGAWLALGAALARAPRIGLAVVVALAVLRAAQADTPSLDWGAEWYQRRAGNFLAFMRSDLLRKHPEVAPGSRLYFTEVPSNVGFLTTGGPALRAWYREPRLEAGFFSEYRRRTGGTGEDRFFRYDSTSGWIEIAHARAEGAEARKANPRWERDHRELASTFARAEDWAGAAIEYERLAEAEPTDPEYALDAAICYETMRDWDRAGRWYSRMLTLPGVEEKDREFARHFELRSRSSK
jgi:hypothetical protein